MTIKHYLFNIKEDDYLYEGITVIQFSDVENTNTSITEVEFIYNSANNNFYIIKNKGLSGVSDKQAQEQIFNETKKSIIEFFGRIENIKSHFDESKKILNENDLENFELSPDIKSYLEVTINFSKNLKAKMIYIKNPGTDNPKDKSKSIDFYKKIDDIVLRMEVNNPKFHDEQIKKLLKTKKLRLKSLLNNI